MKKQKVTRQSSAAKNSRFAKRSAPTSKNHDPDIRQQISILHKASAKWRDPESITMEDAPLYLSVANMQLCSLVNFATIYEQAAKTEDLPQEIAEIFRNFSDSMHSIAFCLDDALSHVACAYGLGWWPVYTYEDELTTALDEKDHA